MNGAIEIAPRISMADAICDIVSTGTTYYEWIKGS